MFDSWAKFLIFSSLFQGAEISLGAFGFWVPGQKGTAFFQELALILVLLPKIAIFVDAQ